MGVTKPAPIDAASIDSLFLNAAKKRKAEFSLELAAEFADRPAMARTSLYRTSSLRCSTSFTRTRPSKIRHPTMRLPLTDEQKHAATQLGGPRHIEASPGAGKPVATERYGVARFVRQRRARCSRPELRPLRTWRAPRAGTPAVGGQRDAMAAQGVDTRPPPLLHRPAAPCEQSARVARRTHELEVVDSWRCHNGGWWRDAGTYRRGLYIDVGKVKIGGGAAGPAPTASLPSRPTARTSRTGSAPTRRSARCSNQSSPRIRRSGLPSPSSSRGRSRP